jgi:phospholipid/cholesterol/gamma-HCH transport system substrate-binding protein
MDTPTGLMRIGPAWSAAALIAAIVAFLWFCSATFAGALRSTVPITLSSDRSGLVMETGAKVKMRGVPVGRVAGIEPGTNPVRLKLDLFPAEVDHIPANTQAQIRSTTIFGAKYVDLIYPENPSAQRITAGTVLQSRNVSAEVNTVFQSLVDVLDKIDPPKLNAVLTAISDAVRGRGQRIGEATTAANHVLSEINPRMGTVAGDLRSAKAAADAYSAAAPDLLAAAQAFTTTSASIASHASDLDTLLLNTIGFAQSGTDLLAPNQTNLVTAINNLEPTTNLLLNYSPEFACTLIGAKKFLDDDGYQVFGGDGRSLILDDAFLFGDDPYRYPDNLPVVAAKGGPGGKPGCGSLPDVSKNYPVRQLVTNTGWGTGLDIRPNPGIGHPWWMDLLPVTRGVPQPPSIRGAGAPAIGPVPYPGAPPYGAPEYGPDGAPMYPPPPGPPAPPTP